MHIELPLTTLKPKDEATVNFYKIREKNEKFGLEKKNPFYLTFNLNVNIVPDFEEDLLAQGRKGYTQPLLMKKQGRWSSTNIDSRTASLTSAVKSSSRTYH